jgi:hypothetical protein
VWTGSAAGSSTRSEPRPIAQRAGRTPEPRRAEAKRRPVERKVALAGFPYVVVYRAATTELQVLAVHHERRRPFYWAARANE